MTKLKTCPFCGSAGLLREKANLKTFVAECSNSSCPASYMIGNDYLTADEAINVWNTRRSTNANNHNISR